jgi:formylglycine-generating enzyme required for sulfatase activity
MQVAYLEILGGIPLASLDPLSQRIIEEAATRLAVDSADVRLANTARWCCTMWQLPVPPFPINHPPDPSRNWFTNSLGQQFAIVDIPERVQCGKPGLSCIWKHVDRRIAIATTETTGAAFEEFLQNPRVRAWMEQDRRERFVEAEGPEDPQCKVSWNLAVRFCQWLNEQERVPEDQWCYLNVWEADSNAFRFAPGYLKRKGYRLPTYAEWKYVCSGRTDDAWHFGSDSKMISLYEWTKPQSNSRRQNAARKRPNAWGVFDIGGSLAEWCDDLSVSPLRNRWRTDNPDEGNSNPTRGMSSREKMILAGGRFRFEAESARSDSMVIDSPDYMTISTGFRVARTLDESNPSLPSSRPR